MNNFEKIKENLTVEKLAELINTDDNDICNMCIFNNDCKYYSNTCEKGIEQWLLKETEDKRG